MAFIKTIHILSKMPFKLAKDAVDTGECIGIIAIMLCVKMLHLIHMKSVKYNAQLRYS